VQYVCMQILSKFTVCVYVQILCRIMYVEYAQLVDEIQHNND